MFSSSSYDNSTPDGYSVLEIVERFGHITERRLFVPLKRSHLCGVVAGPLADLKLVQTFGFSSKQLEGAIEAVYRFPLPGDAAVTGVSVRFGEVTIMAELRERSQAEEEYAEAKRQGKQAALATRESPDVFTINVAGIGPDQDVVVETSYVQMARMEGDYWDLRVPLTTAPRYTRADEAGSRHSHGQPLAIMRDPGHRFSLDLALK